MIHAALARFVLIETVPTNINFESKIQNFSPQTYQRATALDPRFKLRPFRDTAQAERVKADLIHLVNAEQPPAATAEVESDDQDEDDEPAYKRRRRLFFGSMYTVDTDEEASDEVLTYLSEKCIKLETNILHYWRDNAHRFPILAKIAMKHHCIPASSAPVERIFNSGGQFFRPTRNRLSDQAFEKLMFIKCNSHLA